MSTTGRSTSVRSPRGALPVLAVLAVAAIAWFAHESVQNRVQTRLERDLRASVAARAAGIRLWAEGRKREAEALSRDARVIGDLREATSRGSRGATDEELRSAAIVLRLRESLSAPIERSGFDGFAVCDQAGRVLAGGIPIGMRMSVDQGGGWTRVFSGETALVHGFEAMFAAAPVFDGEEVVGAFCLRIDPNNDLVPLLTAGHDPGENLSETFVVTSHGLRFPPSRAAAGDGKTFDLGGPPNVAAANGVAVDVEGYEAQLLGRPVVGAWTSFPEDGLAVVIETEYEQAYAPVIALRETLGLLLVVVLVIGAAGVIAARRNAALTRRVRQAEKAMKQLGQYTLVQKIGEGGMGEVYYARHAMMRRPCAIKLLRPDKTDEHFVARFEREVQNTSRLTHPNTIQIYDYGRTPGDTFYYVMEYLTGVSLDAFVKNEGPLPEGRVIYILRQICWSLNEAHGLGLVHRDIKPANIALCKAGGAFDVVKVLDFGLVMDREGLASREGDASGAITGTPAYLSPEGITDPTKVDARSDLYALGAVGYFLLTGKRIFDTANVMELINRQMKEKPLPPSERIEQPVRPDLEAAVMACLEKNPAKRPKDANALARELEWCLASGEWNRDKARHWWTEHKDRVEELYGLDAKAPKTPSQGTATIAIDLDARDR